MKDGDADFLQRAIRRAERAQCVDIARKIAGNYRELANAQSSDVARNMTLSLADVAELVAREIEGMA